MQVKGVDVLSLIGMVESFTHVVKKLAKNDFIRCSFNDLACEDLDWGETLIFDKGQLTRSSNGLAQMYVHYVCMKRRFFEMPRSATVPDKFYVRKTGIYLERPRVRTICSQEAVRIVRGSIRGAGRLLLRYIG